MGNLQILNLKTGYETSVCLPLSLSRSLQGLVACCLWTLNLDEGGACDEPGANLLVRDHFIIVMMRWTGLAPWEFDTFSR